MSDSPTLDALDRLAAARDFAALRDAAHAAAEADPEAWQPPYHESRALLELGENAAAEALLTETHARFPHLHQVAVLYGYAGAKVLDQADALNRWQTLAAELPAAPGLAIGHAQALLEAGRPTDAEHAVTLALARLPGCVPLLVHHAAMAAERQDWPAARRRWQEVLTHQPNRRDALIGAIGALRETNAPDDAEALAQRALSLYPDDAELNTTCAALATARGDWATTIARLSRAVASRPADEALNLALAGAYQRSGRIGDAKAVLKAGLAHTPDSLPMLRASAEIATHMADWPAAEASWAEVYDRAPPSVAIYHFYAEALVATEAFDEAERLLGEGVGFAPTAKALLIAYAQSADRRFDWTESAMRWNAARRAYPEDAEVKRLIADARKQQTKHITKAEVDLNVIRSIPRRGYLSEKPVVHVGAPRDPIFGPTALDLLRAGKVEVAAAPAAKPGLFGALRRMFGGGK